jgi:transposase
MRVIGLDVHRSFAQVAVLAGTEIVEERRLDLEHDAIVDFGRGLDKTDEVVLESTDNTAAIVRLLQPFVARVVIANPLQMRAFAHARVKTDKVDAAMLAKLHASGFLPEVWSADDATVALRRTVSERVALVRSIRRTKSRIHAVLHANLVPKYAGHLFGKGGRRWLAEVPLPDAERRLLSRQIEELEWLTGRLEALEGQLARTALDDDRAGKLMTVAGINSVVATAVLASIGDISRFERPEKLASYFGLTPRVRQSGDRAAFHGKISRQGNATARTVLLEAAWSAALVPGPLRAFFLRIKDRKGLNVAAVATARKIAVLIWHLLTKDKPYEWARPAFVATKMRKLELKAGAPRAHGKPGPGRDHWIKEIRHREMALVASAEAAYARTASAWKEKPPKPKPG